MHDASQGTRAPSGCTRFAAFERDGQHILLGNRRPHAEIENALGTQPLLQPGSELPRDGRIVPQGLRPVALERAQHAEDQRAAGLEPQLAGAGNGPIDQARPAHHETGPGTAQPGLVAARDAAIRSQLQRLLLPQQDRGDPRAVGVVHEDGGSGLLRRDDDRPDPLGREDIELAGDPCQDGKDRSVEIAGREAAVGVQLGQPGARERRPPPDRRMGAPVRRHRLHALARRSHGEDRRHDTGCGAIEERHPGILAGAEVLARQCGELPVDEGHADPLLGKLVAEIAFPRQEVAAVPREVEQPFAAFARRSGADDVEAVGAAPEFVQGAAKVDAARIADRRIEGIPETILHCPAAPQRSTRPASGFPGTDRVCPIDIRPVDCVMSTKYPCVL